MPAVYPIREGVTDPVDIQCLSIDPDTEVATPVDLTGVSLIVLWLESQDKGDKQNYPDSGSKLEITDRTNGIVRFSPDGTELKAVESVYYGYLRATDAASKIVDFPSDGRFEFPIKAAIG